MCFVFMYACMYCTYVYTYVNVHVCVSYRRTIKDRHSKYYITTIITQLKQQEMRCFFRVCASTIKGAKTRSKVLRCAYAPQRSVHKDAHCVYVCVCVCVDECVDEWLT